MNSRVAATNPRDFGKALQHDKLGLWRYRVRDYRVVCTIEDKRLSVLVVTVGHCNVIYDA